jgi:hypothetical protein
VTVFPAEEPVRTVIVPGTVIVGAVVSPAA